MPTLSGMKPQGFYNKNSSYQLVTMEAVIGWGEEAIASADLPAPPAVIHIADYGCSEGKNSIQAMGHVIEALRRVRPEQPLAAIHCDLPSNNFNQLFQNLHDPREENYLQEGGRLKPHVSALACGGSFYERQLPTGSVHFGMSFLAVEWMDRTPEIPVPDFIGYMESTPAVKAAYARQADIDMTHFLQSRAAELAPGGKLLLIIPGRDGQHACSDGIYHVLNDAACDLVAEGRIAQQRFEQFSMPVYFRTLEELTAPLHRSDSPVSSAFTIDRAETLHLPVPFVDAFRQTGDLEAYAGPYTGFLRAFSEPVVASGLLDHDNALVDALYSRIHDRLIAEPERYLPRNIEVAFLLTRR